MYREFSSRELVILFVRNSTAWPGFLLTPRLGSRLGILFNTITTSCYRFLAQRNCFRRDDLDTFEFLERKWRGKHGNPSRYVRLWIPRTEL